MSVPEKETWWLWGRNTAALMRVVCVHIVSKAKSVAQGHKTGARMQQREGVQCVSCRWMINRESQTGCPIT